MGTEQNRTTTVLTNSSNLQLSHHFATLAPQNHQVVKSSRTAIRPIRSTTARKLSYSVADSEQFMYI